MKPSNHEPRARWSTLGPGVCLAILASSAGCLSGSPQPLPASHERPEVDSGSIRVRLVFGAEADLDLYVTDPLQETVYFGNNPSRGGGTLQADLRCDAPPLRTEVVTFPDAIPGRYRVGVAFSARCARVRQAVPYRIEIDARGLRIDETGEIAPGDFDHKALEIDLDGRSEH
jgi:hypothetical protein